VLELDGRQALRAHALLGRGQARLWVPDAEAMKDSLRHRNEAKDGLFKIADDPRVARVGGWHRRRLELTPGMTGHWQILGPARVPLAEMVAIDYLYVANWSLWKDVKILLRTVPLVIGRRGL
jgi:hypothetical protein